MKELNGCYATRLRRVHFIARDASTTDDVAVPLLCAFFSARPTRDALLIGDIIVAARP